MWARNGVLAQRGRAERAHSLDLGEEQHVGAEGHNEAHDGQLEDVGRGLVDDPCAEVGLAQAHSACTRAAPATRQQQQGESGKAIRQQQQGESGKSMRQKHARAWIGAAQQQEWYKGWSQQ